MFQPVEQWVERCDVKTNRAARALFDEFADFVAVTRTGFDERENQQLGATFFPFDLGSCVIHIWGYNILYAFASWESSECFLEPL